jgi:L-lactate dehydrogenase complex protein LldE
MANSGAEAEARATEELFIRNFAAFEYIVTPSGSCTHHVRTKFIAAPPGPARDHVRSHVYDLVEFVHDVVQVREFPWAAFPHKVALHSSCSAIRGLFLQSMSERVNDPPFSKPRELLRGVKGLELVEFERDDPPEAGCGGRAGAGMGVAARSGVRDQGAYPLPPRPLSGAV